MNILLIYTNTNRYLSPPPVGIAYLIPPLKRESHKVRVLDLMFSKRPSFDIHHSISNFHPDIVGFSIRNLDNQYMLLPDNPLPEIREYIRMVKNKNIPVIIGGTAFTSLPEGVLNYMDADYGIAGQGEEAFPLLLKALKGKKGFNDIPGLVYRKNGVIIKNPPSICGYAQKIPDWSDINIKKYRRTFWPVSVIIKTGCEFNCLYCDNCKSLGHKMIARDIDSIIKDIRNIIETKGCRVLFFSDPCLSNPTNFAKELFRTIIQERLSIQFCSTLEPAHGCCDEEFFELYLRAGGIFSILGCESFSPTMLKNYRKPFKIEDVYQWCKLAKKAGLKFGAELLFGGPGENESTVKETMEAMANIENTLFMYSIGIRIYPKTGLFDIAQREGIIHNEEDLLFPKFYVSKDLDMEWARNYIARAAKKYSRRAAGMLTLLLRNLIGKYTGIIIH